MGQSHWLAEKRTCGLKLGMDVASPALRRMGCWFIFVLEFAFDNMCIGGPLGAQVAFSLLYIERV